ncbi:HET-domain-containing protein [Xylariaceae sp. FL0255]|nr:HET-domain-containing protein [Xylariaceae sp. FL0255]
MESFAGVSPHRPLNAETGEIRIVTLFPDTFGGPIRCEIEHIILGEGADYEAVSYCWGDAKITEPILLDGKPYPVTLNLFEALRYLRLEDSPRKLWVDSLCINQQDLEERAREVKRMCDIYTFAKEVLVWIGPYHPYTYLQVRQLFATIEEFGRIPTIPEMHNATKKFGYDFLWRFAIDLRDFIHHRPWFGRMWVVQEVSVRPMPEGKFAERTPNLICGHLKVSFARLARVLVFILAPQAGYLSLPKCSPSARSLVDVWGHYQVLELQDSDDEIPPVGRQLAWFLSQTSGIFDATDRRDIIFALVGLLRTTEKPRCLILDYSRDIHELLFDCAEFILQDSLVLEILQFNSMKTKNLPSWVPDWNHSSVLPFFLLFDQDPHPLSHAHIFHDTKNLEVDIISFTTVASVGFAFLEQEDIHGLHHQWLEFCSKLEEFFTKCRSVDPRFDSFMHEIWILIHVFNEAVDQSGISIFPDPSTKPHADFYGDWIGGFENPRNAQLFETKIVKDHLEHMANSIAGKYFFSCQDGSIGVMKQFDVVPALGDCICSIRGAYCEFILRPQPRGYTLVGQCVRTSMGPAVSSIHELIDVYSHVGRFRTAFETLWEDYACERILIA